MTSQSYKNNNTIKANTEAVRLKILAYIKSCRKNGATCDQVEQALGIPHQTASARCTELKKLNKVQVIGKRKTRLNCFAAILFADGK